MSRLPSGPRVSLPICSRLAKPILCIALFGGRDAFSRTRELQGEPIPYSCVGRYWVTGLKIESGSARFNDLV